MPITQITAPSALPLTTGDYQAQNNLTDARLSSEAMPLGSGVILKGSKFIIKGATFIASADTAITGTPFIASADTDITGTPFIASADTDITGTPSNYVVLTVTGTDAVPTYVASLTGVTWSDIYNGYYDASENYVWFDEMKAYILGAISTPKIIYNKIISDITDQVLKITSDVEFNSVVTPTVSASSVSATTVTATGAIAGASIDTGNGPVELDQDLLTTSDLVVNSAVLNGVSAIGISWVATTVRSTIWDILKSTGATGAMSCIGYVGANEANYIDYSDAIDPQGRYTIETSNGSTLTSIWNDANLMTSEGKIIIVGN